MKYFLDTEFLEGKQDKTFLGIKYGETKPTIDLISIGIVSEEQYYQTGAETNKKGIATMQLLTKTIPSREYYAISKDFNLKAAWKNEWIRENVLKHIWEELIDKELDKDILAYFKNPFTYKGLKYLINKYGKTNKQISEEIYEFCSNDYHKGNGLSFKERKTYPLYDKFKPEFYGYYNSYDWVVFCQLFGTMMDLPNGFPYYCTDLKQMLDNKLSGSMKRDNQSLDARELVELRNLSTLNERLDWIKQYSHYYPKQTNEHNALSDARWNKQLYEFLKTL